MNSKGIQPISQSLSSLRNISVQLHNFNNMQWFEVVENCNDIVYDSVLSKLPYADCEQNSVLYTFNDKLFPSQLSPFIHGG